MSIHTQDLLPDVEKKFIPYLKKMIEIHQGNLISVSLYGSATGHNYFPKGSDINSVFIFKTLNFITFQKSLKVVQRGLAQKIAAPLFLSQEYIQSSLDVFPIEFWDMKENHVVLFGEDILAQLQIKGEYLRLFCEQQIRGKLLRIRQAYLNVGLDRRKIRGLLKESLN